MKFVGRVKAYAALAKLRLASLVVVSAVLSYFLAQQDFNGLSLMLLIGGGFLITGASNGFNQVIEKDLDAMMNRTKGRPIPAGRISSLEAFVVSSVLGITGALMLFSLNQLSGLLGVLALILYVGLYTPLKRVTPFAVFVGAFPGAIPPMLGYIGATGEFGLIPGLLFAIQFMWQFPHFWAIAWKLDEDYSRAGFYLLPSKSGKGKASAVQMLVYTIGMIGVSITPYYFDVVGIVGSIGIVIMGLWMLFYAFRLFQTCEDKYATKLMFSSFVYLPIVQIILLLDRVI